MTHIRDIRAELARLASHVEGIEVRRVTQGDCPPADGLLHDAMAQAFNLEELRQLALRLNVNIEEMQGDGVSGQALSLVLWLRRRSRLAELVQALTRERPHVQWQTYL